MISRSALLVTGTALYHIISVILAFIVFVQGSKRFLK